MGSLMKLVSPIEGHRDDALDGTGSRALCGATSTFAIEQLFLFLLLPFPFLLDRQLGLFLRFFFRFVLLSFFAHINLVCIGNGTIRRAILVRYPARRTSTEACKSCFYGFLTPIILHGNGLTSKSPIFPPPRSEIIVL